MNKQTFFKERGQTLIVIAFAAVGLFAFAALAIDGGIVFSDRRHSQNASDTAALAAALARARATANWEQSGLDRAEVNGYSNATGSIVEVHLCSNAGATCTNLPAGAEDQYVQARITSTVKLFFARIIGWQEVTNHTDAIARASVPEVTPWFDGNALVSTMEGCRSASDPNDPFTIGGNGTTIINDSGIFVNSTCNPAFTDNGNSNLVTTDEGVCVVGGVPGNVTGVSPYPDGNCSSQVDPSKYQLPNPVCSQAGSITGSGGNYEAWPGYFPTSGNQTFPNVSPSGTLKLHKGIYCLNKGISLDGNWFITTDLNDNDVHDSDSEGVFFYIPGGDVTFNGGSTMEIYAINSLADDYPEQFLNYLIYIPPSNEANVTITGNNGSIFTGTILAPTSHVTLNGSGNSFSLDTQIIGYDLTITGGGYIDITYNQANNAVAITNPGIELTE
jgi:Flp pilus assembly protein TadG